MIFYGSEWKRKPVQSIDVSYNLHHDSGCKLPMQLSIIWFRIVPGTRHPIKFEMSNEASLNQFILSLLFPIFQKYRNVVSLSNIPLMSLHLYRWDLHIINVILRNLQTHLQNLSKYPKGEFCKRRRNVATRPLWHHFRKPDTDGICMS